MGGGHQIVILLVSQFSWSLAFGQPCLFQDVNSCRVMLLIHIQGGTFGGGPGLGRLGLGVFHCLPNSALADGNSAEGVGQVG